MEGRTQLPDDEWVITEREYSAARAGHTETVFALGNGYLGLRGNHPDVAQFAEHGTFINGFHETWPIQHAEDAYGLAEVGQTIVNVPDAKPMWVEVLGERFSLDTSEISEYERELDMRSGVLRRSVVWQTRAGVRLRLDFERVVSFVHRHLAAQRLRVTVLDPGPSHGAHVPVPITIISSIMNRQDEHAASSIVVNDPRRSERVEGRVLVPIHSEFGDQHIGLAYRTVASGLAVATAVRHAASMPAAVVRAVAEDHAFESFALDVVPGGTFEVSKFAAYTDGVVANLHHLVDDACDVADHALTQGWAGVLQAQQDWLAEFWERSDVVIPGHSEMQQSVRWCLFQLAQASARADGRGIAAKGVTGSGYSGHYFWDTEVYVLPFLSYTNPDAARNALHMRVDMLPAARKRAAALSEVGALYPWRTINGEEASAYFPAGTAQYHIDADVTYAVAKYVRATGDIEFLATGGIDIAVETARMWRDLGFWRRGEFHLYGVTGPDEYSAVVNDNLYTNVMARFNLRYAGLALQELKYENPAAYLAAVSRLAIHPDEIDGWNTAAEAMYVGFDDALGIHLQDSSILDRELWDFAGTPNDKYPLLLHFHPLVIYRHQVLKQADAVLALFLQGHEFTAEQKLADFEYYDPITTGDSTLSGVVQAIMAAEVGYAELAVKYFDASRLVDLADLHHNAVDGVHVASAGGVWSALVYGFAGMRDTHGGVSFDPRLPAEWPELSFALTVAGRRLRVHLEQHTLTVEVLSGDSWTFTVRGETYTASVEVQAIVPLAHQGPRTAGAPDRHVAS